jgi:cell division protein FtsQ
MRSLSTSQHPEFENATQLAGSSVTDSANPRWVAILIGLLIASLFLLFVADRLFHPENFQIEEIEVRGQFNHVNGAEVKKIVEGALEGNYFSMSLKKLEWKITQLPWIYSAALRRKWPATLVVDVVEVQPVAIWGQRQWLNFTGDLVGRQDVLDEKYHVDQYKKLPLLFGPDHERHAVWKAFQDWSGRFASNGLVLDELGLDKRGLWHMKISLSALVRNSEETIQPTNTVPVSLVVDRENADARIWRFIDALNHALISRFLEIKSIDLRYPNGFAVQWYELETVAQSQFQPQTDAE